MPEAGKLLDSDNFLPWPPPVLRVPDSFEYRDDRRPFQDFEEDKVVMHAKSRSDFAVFICFATSTEEKILQQLFDPEALNSLARRHCAEKHEAKVIDLAIHWQQSHSEKPGLPLSTRPCTDTGP